MAFVDDLHVRRLIRSRSRSVRSKPSPDDGAPGERLEQDRQFGHPCQPLRIQTLDWQRHSGNADPSAASYPVAPLRLDPPPRGAGCELAPRGRPASHAAVTGRVALTEAALPAVSSRRQGAITRTIPRPETGALPRARRLLRRTCSLIPTRIACGPALPGRTVENYCPLRIRCRSSC